MTPVSNVRGLEDAILRYDEETRHVSLRLLRTLNLSRSEVHDLAQEIVFRTLQGLRDGKESFQGHWTRDRYRAFIWRIGWHVGLELIRNRDIASSHAREVAHRLEGRGYLSSESRKLLLEAVQTLPQSSREVLELYLNGETVAMIGGKLNITKSAVRKRLWRARKALRRKLGDDAHLP